MSAERIGGRPAWPTGRPYEDGMTYREWLVGTVAAALAHNSGGNHLLMAASVADMAVKVADAVLARLASEEKP